MGTTALPGEAFKETSIFPAPRPGADDEAADRRDFRGF
jgi:hypothetical protein